MIRCMRDRAALFKRRELESKKAEHDDLPIARQRRIHQLEREMRDRQMEKFLDGFRIDKIRISGIGHARKITLRSYGIETAADVRLICQSKNGEDIINTMWEDRQAFYNAYKQTFVDKPFRPAR